MKKALLVLFFAATAGAASAQTQFGLKAGANFATLTGDDADDAKMKVGLNVGAFARLPISETFKVQPELIYSLQGAKFEDEGEEAKFNTSYINVPVMLQYHTASGFFAETGPQVGFLATAKAKYEDVEVDIKDSFKSIDFSWGIGVGYQMASGFGVNARYNLGLSNIGEEFEGETANVKNSVIQVGVFYTLGGGGN